MIPNIRNWRLATLFVFVAVAATPAFAQNCDLADSGDPLQQYQLDRLPECGGIAPTPAPQGGGGSLTTLFASNNQGQPTGGVYFDLEVVGTNDVNIKSWDTNLDDTFVGDVSVWYRPGTSAGFESDPAGWTLVGTATGVVSAGTDVPTPVDVGIFTIAAGDTNGIAIALAPTAGAVGHHYTNGDGTNETYNDGVLELRAGSANNIALSPGTVFSLRVWNGTVYYNEVIVDEDPAFDVAIPTLGQFGLLALLLGLGGAGLAVIRRRRNA